MMGRFRAWLQALRLKFYPMSWLAYAAGAIAAGGGPGVLAAVPFWAGLAFLFFLEVATVLCNEYFDYASDRLNHHAGSFSGGSRVLVDGLLGFGEIRAGIAAALLLSALAAAAVLASMSGSVAVAGLWMAALAVLALGYTVPPLKLSWRSLGELDVGITDSIGVMLCGWLFLGGNWRDPFPWLLSLPLGLAFIPSITLCAVPDRDADSAAGKRTLAVRFGIAGAARIAQAFALLAAAAALAMEYFLLPGSYGPVVWLSLAHALALAAWLRVLLAPAGEARRIDALMIASLSFVIWFGVLPLWMLLN